MIFLKSLHDSLNCRQRAETSAERSHIVWKEVFLVLLKVVNGGRGFWERFYFMCSHTRYVSVYNSIMRSQIFQEFMLQCLFLHLKQNQRMHQLVEGSNPLTLRYELNRQLYGLVAYE